jgi:hypothetical protein
MVDNADHIAWAADAVAVFQKHCGTGDEHAIADLICDLPDIAMECHRRFDQLLQLQHELDAKLSNKRRKDPKYSLTDEDRQAAYDYYARFFSLQPRRLPLARRLSAYAQIAAPARQAAMLLRHRTAR